jgi:hypothetical protein
MKTAHDERFVYQDLCIQSHCMQCPIWLGDYRSGIRAVKMFFLRAGRMARYRRSAGPTPCAADVSSHLQVSSNG